MCKHNPDIKQVKYTNLHPNHITFAPNKTILRSIHILILARYMASAVMVHAVARNGARGESSATVEERRLRRRRQRREHEKRHSIFASVTERESKKLAHTRERRCRVCIQHFRRFIENSSSNFPPLAGPDAGGARLSNYCA